MMAQADGRSRTPACVVPRTSGTTSNAAPACCRRSTAHAAAVCMRHITWRGTLAAPLVCCSPMTCVKRHRRSAHARWCWRRRHIIVQTAPRRRHCGAAALPAPPHRRRDVADRAAAAVVQLYAGAAALVPGALDHNGGGAMAARRAKGAAPLCGGGGCCCEGRRALRQRVGGSGRCAAPPGLARRQWARLGCGVKPWRDSALRPMRGAEARRTI